MSRALAAFAIGAAAALAAALAAGCYPLCYPYCDCEECRPSTSQLARSIWFSPDDPELAAALAACLDDDLSCGELCNQLLGPLPPNTTRTIEQCYLTGGDNGSYQAHITYIRRTYCPDPYVCPEGIQDASPIYDARPIDSDAAPAADAGGPDGAGADAGSPDGGAPDAGAPDAGGAAAARSWGSGADQRLQFRRARSQVGAPSAPLNLLKRLVATARRAVEVGGTRVALVDLRVDSSDRARIDGRAPGRGAGAR